MNREFMSSECVDSECLDSESVNREQGCPRLVFCIPTHHGRAVFLREALESILSQLGGVPAGSVRISISDNASEDETQAMVEELRRTWPGTISYSRNAENLGFTPNMLRAVSEADGDFGWIFSSDDRIAPGGVRAVWEALYAHPDLAGMSVNFCLYDLTMTRTMTQLAPRLYPADPANPHVYESLEEAFQECGSVMGYVSGQVVNLRVWREVLSASGTPLCFEKNYFPYVHLFGEMLKRRSRWMWLPEPVVENRQENDSVTQDLNRNIVAYQTFILRDMTTIWADLLGARSPAYRKLVRDNFATTWRWRAICSYKATSCCTLADEVRALTEYTRRLYFLPEFWLTTFPVLMIPHGVFRAAAAAARRLGLMQRRKLV